MNSFPFASILPGLILTGLAASASGASCDKPCKEPGNPCARVIVNASLSVENNVEKWTVSMSPETLYQHRDVKKIIWILNEGFVFYPRDPSHDGVAFKDITQANYNEPSVIDDDEKPTTDKSKRFRWCVKGWTLEMKFPYAIAFSEQDGTTRGRKFECDPTIINSDSKPKEEPILIAKSIQCNVTK